MAIPQGREGEPQVRETEAKLASRCLLGVRDQKPTRLYNLLSFFNTNVFEVTEFLQAIHSKAASTWSASVCPQAEGADLLVGEQAVY